MRESKRMTNTMKQLVSGRANISSSLTVQKCRLYPEGSSKYLRFSACVNFKQPHAFTDLMEAEDLLSVPSSYMDKEIEQKLISAWGNMQYLPCTSPS